MKNGLLPISNIEEASVLANLQPYTDTNANGIVTIFVDENDNWKLKALIFDDTQPNDERVVQLSFGAGGTGDGNIYDNDGTLQGDRVVAGGGFDLTFNTLDLLRFLVGGGIDLVTTGGDIDMVNSGGGEININTVNGEINIASGLADIDIASAMRVGISGITGVDILSSGNVVTIQSLTYPNTDGNEGGLMQTDGAGVLSFVDVYKAGEVDGASFTGNPKKLAIVFGTAFAGGTTYSISILGTGTNNRNWTAESISETGFTINANSNPALSGPVQWIVVRDLDA